jgi:hypothetical protein
MEAEIRSLAAHLADNPAALTNLHNLEAFQALVTAAVGPDVPPEPRGLLLPHRLDVEWSLRSFLSRVHFADMLPTVDEARATALAEEYRTAVATADAEIETLIVIDGLDAYSHDFGDIELVQLEGNYLREFFADGSTGSIPFDDLEDLYAFRFRRRTPGNPSWTDFGITYETVDHRIRTVAAPWLSFLNLYGGPGGFVRAIAMYERSDSLVTWPPVRATVGGAPSMRPAYIGDEDEHEIWEHDHRLVVHDRDAFARFLNHAQQGYRAAVGVSHRTETAMRFFARAVEAYDSIDQGYFHDAELSQDALIDLVSALEAIYLTDADGRGKGQRIANRAAVLCGDEVPRQREIRRQLGAAYDNRSAILHGDVQPTHEEITGSVRQLAPIVVDSLVGLLRLHGDQQRLIEGERNPVVADQNRGVLRAP